MRKTKLALKRGRRTPPHRQPGVNASPTHNSYLESLSKKPEIAKALRIDWLGRKTYAFSFEGDNYHFVVEVPDNVDEAVFIQTLFRDFPKLTHPGDTVFLK